MAKNVIGPQVFKANILPSKDIYPFSLKSPKAEMQLLLLLQTPHLRVSATPDSVLKIWHRELDRCNPEDATGKQMNAY